MIGRLIDDRYEIIARIGSGGMATVYKAYCTILNRYVAVKILKPEFAQDDSFVRSFKNEAQAVASLSHPNIVAVYDVGHHRGLHYIVMEYVEGGTLKDLIKQSAPLPLERVVDISSEILSALSEAHSHRIIHRDIKPQNVLLTQSGHVKLTDFGLARAATSSTLVHTSTVVGSAHYFSPEQARGGFTNEQSDVYSVGAILYEMVTGQVPFAGTSPVSVAVRHIQDEVEPPRAINQELPPQFEAVIMQALSKRREDRFQSAPEMKQAVVNWQQFVPPAPVPDSEDNQATRILSPAGKADVGAATTQPHIPAGASEATGRGAGKDGGAGRSPGSGGQGGRGQQEPRRVRPEPLLPEEPAERARRRWLRALIVTAFIVIVLAGAAYGGMKAWHWLNPAIVKVPAVTGMPLDKAQAALKKEGFSSSISGQQYNSQYDPGTIISQDPAGGSEARVTHPVRLIVSKGPQYVQGGMPDLSGMSQREANIALQAANLQGEFSQDYSDTVPSGQVMQQTPAAGQQVTEGQTVQVVISQGPQPHPASVPDLTGQTYADATKALQDNGFKLGQVSYQKSDLEQGRIVSQDPGGGQQAMTGSKVDLVVSSGCAQQQTVNIDTSSAPDDPVQVVVKVQDVKGMRTVYNKQRPRGTQVQVPVCWSGSQARVLVFFNQTLSGQQVVSKNNQGGNQ